MLLWDKMIDVQKRQKMVHEIIDNLRRAIVEYDAEATAK